MEEKIKAEKKEKQEKSEERIIIDAKNAVLGRLAARVAKKALFGKSIAVCNCNDIIIKGKPQSILEHYRKKVARGNPLKGPFFPRTADRIVRRTIRGMLPYKKQHGMQAFKRIMCFNSMPLEYENKERVSFKQKPALNYIKLGRLCSLLGSRK